MVVTWVFFSVWSLGCWYKVHKTPCPDWLQQNFNFAEYCCQNEKPPCEAALFYLFPWLWKIDEELPKMQSHSAVRAINNTSILLFLTNQHLWISPEIWYNFRVVCWDFPTAVPHHFRGFFPPTTGLMGPERCVRVKRSIISISSHNLIYSHNSTKIHAYIIILNGIVTGTHYPIESHSTVRSLFCRILTVFTH